MSREDDDGFLERWSRRKRRASREEPEERRPESEPARVPAETERSETDEELLARLDLPDPETLGPGDDFARFLRAPLPAHLKQRALRRLWRSNPVLANLDGLNDYDTDFTGNTVPLGTLKTAYRVGHGFLSAGFTDDATTDAGAAGARDNAREEQHDADNATKVAGAANGTVSEPTEADDGEDPRQNLSDSPPEEGSEEAVQDFAAKPTARRMAFRFGK